MPQHRDDPAHDCLDRLAESLAGAELDRAGPAAARPHPPQTQRRWCRSSMAPALAYGRHRGPAAERSRVAAVAIALFRDAAGQWTIPLTLRPATLTHHGGQISLPGGGLEPGETLLDAALREYAEELGVPAQLERCCGELSTQYVYASDHRVHPLVIAISRPTERWRPDPAEVAAVIELPLAELADPQRRNTSIRERVLQRAGVAVGSFSFRAPHFEAGGRQIWGATAIILDELAQVTRSLAMT